MWYRFAAHGSVGVLGAFQAVYRLHGANMSHTYFTTYRLPDLRHRQAAIETFFSGDGSSMRRAAVLRKGMIGSLAKDATGFASAAFNDGDFKACDELTAYALTLSPTVRFSAPWIKLESKRRLGLRGWRAIAPAVKRLRLAARRVRASDFVRADQGASSAVVAAPSHLQALAPGASSMDEDGR